MTHEELQAIKARAEEAEMYPEAEQMLDKDVRALVAEVERLRSVVERLGSSEAFTVPMMIDDDDPRAEELRARLDFAREAMK